jgi:hypothetical protein
MHGMILSADVPGQWWPQDVVALAMNLAQLDVPEKRCSAKERNFKGYSDV